MGPALERLLASPSALRLLRHICSSKTNIRSKKKNNKPNGAFACLLHTRTSPPSCLKPSPCPTPISSRRLAVTGAHNTVHTRTKSNHARLDKPVRPQRPPNRREGSYLAVLISLYTGTPLMDKIREGEDPFDTLVHEAAVTAPSTRSRLVDDPVYAQNMHLWLELLRFRKRLHGHPGIRDVWSGMMQRNLDLPVSGPVADAIWSTFLSAAFSDTALFLEVYNHAKRLGRFKSLHRPHLYRDIVGGWLRINPQVAEEWHGQMQQDGLVPWDAASVVFEHALRSQSPQDAFRVFTTIYTNTGASGMYDSSMSQICDLCGFADAFKWHTFFVSYDDVPSQAILARPDISHLSTHYSLSSKQRVERDDSARQEFAALQTFPRTNPDTPVLTRESMNTLVGDVHGIKQKKIGDAFCARLFATGAFSIDLVITGLRMVGLDALGALALREIAARVHGPSEYLSALHSLDRAGISIAESAYSRALNMFAEEGNTEYFDVVVKSDLHPDTYGDVAVMKKLFTSSLAAERVQEAHMILAVMTMSRPDPDHDSWNILLQTYTSTSDRQHVLQILQEMRLRGITLSEKSLDVIFHQSLGARQVGRRPVQGHGRQSDKDLDFVTNVFLAALRSGQDLEPTRWRELLKRYGMTGRFLSLERLVLWLAAWHSTRPRDGINSALGFPNQAHHDSKATVAEDRLHLKDWSLSLSQIFTPSLIRAIVAWGFISSVPPFRHEQSLQLPHASPSPLATDAKQVVPERWARGIALVRKLEDYGVDLSHTKFRREVKIRLWMLFGPGRSATKHSRLAQQRNKQRLLHYVRHIGNVWGGPFFRLPRDYIDRVAFSERLVHEAIFGTGSRVGYHASGLGGQRTPLKDSQRMNPHPRKKPPRLITAAEADKLRGENRIVSRVNSELHNMPSK